VETADVVIVGGGIVGSAAAYFLTVLDPTGARRVVVAEQDLSYARSCTARSVGGLRQQFSTPENIVMSQATLALFRGLKETFGEDADVAFREQGYLIMASPQGRARLAGNVAVQRAHGADVVLLDREQLGARFPWLATEGVEAGAFGQSGEGWFDPMSLMALFRRTAQARGVLYVHDRVVGIQVQGRVEAVTFVSGKRIKCGALVNAAGASAGEVAALAGVALPVEARKRYVYVIYCRDAPDSLRRAPLTVDPSGVWFRPEGRVFLCGLSPDESREPPATNLDDVDYAFFESEVWPHLAARVPAFERVKAINAWAGFYDFNTFDQNAVIGPHPEIRNFLFANGFSGHGAQQAAAAGRAIAELILFGAYRTLDLTRLGYTRIAQNRPLIEHNVI
jgi:sarcosine oxidase